MSGDDVKKITVTGTVAKEAMGGSSKSAHKGFVLQQKSHSIKLRREGGNPFYDDFFEKYEGKFVTIYGFDMKQYFLVMSIEEKNFDGDKK